MPVTENAGVHLHWDERGEGSPVLLIMGHRFSSAMWYPVLPALTEHHRVIWFDNRGSGASDTTRDATLDDLVADTVAVLDAAGVERAHVHGVSMGGGIAQQLAMSHPERVTSLVLGCTAILTADKPRPGRVARLAGRLVGHLPFRMIAPRLRGMYGPAASEAAIDRDLTMVQQDRCTTRGVIAQSHAVAGWQVTLDDVARIDVPALVVHGTADTLVPLAWGEELAQTLPNARFITYEGAGHSYHVAAGEQANADVLAFLAEVDAG